LYGLADYFVYPARTTIFREGDKGDFMYVILKGKVSIKKGMDERPEI
jgi:CRP-like cAMP-binding protein